MNITAPMIDSHCHLNSIDLSEFNGSIKELLRTAKEVGIQHMLCVCVEPSDVAPLYQLANEHPNISISVGVHPTVEPETPVDATQLIQWANHKSCIAIGETGLDYYRIDGESPLKLQQEKFRQHIHAAKRTSKPLIIHTRQAPEDTIQIMAEENAAEIGGVMHCFTESWEVAKKALDLNFYISFSGILTFKNAKDLQEVAKKVPLERILIETDAPYLAPVPFRGKQNHPALVKYVAMALSELKQLDVNLIAKETTDNFYRCFRIKELA